ncbi:MAG TPA: Gfo/Idh/MocA family oxidoreductase [Phycisphaerae bacterium]|nr:Gfo/Idh/MocA family oxidoreductase [Phycisphaerae bacterium]
MQNRTSSIGRRTFLAGAGAAAFTIVKPSLVRGTEANSTLSLGMIGCGGRGDWIAKLFNKHGKYRFVACADYFQERVDAFGEAFGVDASRRYTTLSGYKKLLDEKLDAVVIQTPPYAHPEQSAAAVDAGKHVFVAKPIAVDVPGCLSIEESGRKATARKLVFLIDFQTRAHPLYREALRRVHAGEIGRLMTGDAHYPTRGIFVKPFANPEERLRYWYAHTDLAGNFIVEQSIHALDVATWVANAAPIRAYGTGGKKVRKVGDIWDHFNLIYHFPDDFVLSFYCVQAAPGAPDEIFCRVYGSEGTIETDYYGHVWIHGNKPYEGGTFNDMYEAGAVINIKEFHEAVTGGKHDNPTVVPSVRSNLTAILGRTAGYRHGMVTWDELIKANERIEPDLKGLKA